MAVVMVMEWPEVQRGQYEAVRNELDWVSNKPKGAMLHVAGWSQEKGFRVVDIWESASDFQAFAQEKLAAATQRAGLTTQPRVEFFDTWYIDQLALP